MCESFVNNIANLSLNTYESLGKTGKPTADEWTTLCSIVIEENNTFLVACLATGTKCVTGQWASFKGAVIDCHAECLCKRAFKRFLISHVQSGKSFDTAKFHLFISQLPCGVVDRYKGNIDKPCVGVRRKPGKGERCLKPSCVDKLCKWNILGLQGRRLLAFTKKPIRFETIIIGNCGQENEFDENK
ncbi:double-stranded RNA-specific editase 1-like protein [Leptotrombidium deliense]|uniref:tRNA-specific adenosine deaminase 1 n=1 Tax=Leptotrombidium deliense TaxID=299467 RepID=A0A443SRM0_9ACAR|nr:double-stranded RNA-specific editase 1-like protein [Leptotrombidium deliense]